MAFDPASFRLHDLSEFPLVWARPGAAESGAQWQQEMETLLANGAPFVMLHADAPDAPDLRTTRISWFGRNRQRLARVCAAIVAVEPDRFRRAALKAQAALINQALGIRTAIAATAEEAEDIAWELLFRAPSIKPALPGDR